MRALALVLVLASCASSAPPTAPVPGAPGSTSAVTPRPWPIPAGWREETIPFPLGFAPSLPYRGVEHLRFAPGFFDPAADSYWSYAFVWILDEAPLISVDGLERDLDTYFRGLMSAIADGKREIPAEAVRVSLAATSGAGQHGALTMTGRIDVLAAFTNWEPVSLAARGKAWTCGTRTIVLFAASPQPPDHRVWTELDELIAAFVCSP